MLRRFGRSSSRPFCALAAATDKMTVKTTAYKCLIKNLVIFFLVFLYMNSG